ncbi:hypothetical protein CHARACLAT_031570 [Characodon lateralis]|uniref:Uncharacterized protein n=1 Tax=Characodon lateralis TaxID=208331 RepID=A0ABU7DXH0_9TELE|nr:hypothetical protein [Characodon lateralis]
MPLPGGTYYYTSLNWTLYLLATAKVMQGRMITGERRTGLDRHLELLPSIMMHTVLLLWFCTSAPQPLALVREACTKRQARLNFFRNFLVYYYYYYCVNAEE